MYVITILDSVFKSASIYVWISLREYNLQNYKRTKY